MINRAFIHEYGNGCLEPEHLAVKQELESRKVPVQLFTSKKLNRRQLPLTPTSLVVGEIPIVHKALKYLGIESLMPNSYPTCLQNFLHRKIWSSTLGVLIHQLQNGELRQGVFIKPASQAKKFNGCIVALPDDARQFQGISLQTPIHCSETVQWLAEYRVFVCQGKIIGIKHYDGNPEFTLDRKTIKEAIDLLSNSRENTAGYSVDFGVLANGKTALVEWNDGFSLGAYQLDPALYADLLIARWEELTQSLPPS